MATPTTQQPPTAPLERRTSATSAHIHNLANKVSRALSPNRTLGGASERRTSLGGAMQTDLESQRGRQAAPIVSTGRGGAGNLIRSPSRGIDPEITPGSERGRETSTQRDMSGDRAVRSGRGGAGNIRSPSRDPVARLAEQEESTIQERLIAEERGRQADAPFSTGRGGAGNFSRDKSRSRSAVRGGDAASVASGAASTATPSKEHHAHASGRGGWGNVKEERESVDLEKEAAAHRYEASLAARYRAEDAGKVHHAGKGGAGNMTTKSLSPEEFAKLNLEEQETFRRLQEKATSNYSSGGRGGAGNYRAKEKDSHLAPAADGERGRDATKTNGHGGIFGNVLRSISRAKGSNGDHRPKD